jgi:hypothetical protein
MGKAGRRWNEVVQVNQALTMPLSRWREAAAQNNRFADSSRTA